MSEPLERSPGHSCLRPTRLLPHLSPLDRVGSRPVTISGASLRSDGFCVCVPGGKNTPGSIPSVHQGGKNDNRVGNVGRHSGEMSTLRLHVPGRRKCVVGWHVVLQGQDPEGEAEDQDPGPESPYGPSRCTYPPSGTRSPNTPRNEGPRTKRGVGTCTENHLFREPLVSWNPRHRDGDTDLRVWVESC